VSTIHVTCPECQAGLKIADTIPAGKKIRCPKCQAAFVVPADDEDDESPPARTSGTGPKQAQAARKPRAEIEDEKDDDPRPKKKVAPRHEEEDEEEDDRPARKKKKKHKKAKGNPALLWSLVGGGVVVVAAGVIALMLILNKGKDSPTGGNSPGNGTRNLVTDLTPDPALVKQLASATKIEGYGIRLPKNYVFSKGPGPAAYRWDLPHRLGDPPTFLSASFHTGRPTDSEKTLDELVNTGIQVMQMALNNYERGESIEGKLNGLTIKGFYYAGKNQATIKPVHGFYYAIKDGNTFITIMSQADDQDKNAFKLIEAASRTFKKA
jgi:predicted Zn finger-like uncharacterized protein